MVETTYRGYTLRTSTNDSGAAVTVIVHNGHRIDTAESEQRARCIINGWLWAP